MDPRKYTWGRERGRGRALDAEGRYFFAASSKISTRGLGGLWPVNA